MWPLPKISNKKVHLIIHQEQLFCYYITNAENIAHCTIIYEQFDIPLITETLIYNPSKFIQVVESFITKHHLKNASSYLVLTKPLVQEQLITHAQPHAQLSDLVSPSHMSHYHYHYIGPHKEGSLFYVCSTKQTLLFQLHILHTCLKLHMQAVRPPLSVQYDLYSYLHPSQTARALVAQTIDTETISFKKLFESTSLHSSMSSNNTLYNKNLVYALGSLIGSHI